MKKSILIALTLIAFSKFSIGQVNTRSTYVSGYFKSNGSYVNGYYRTMPNGTINDNFSTYPNFNPFTGIQGTIQPTYTYPTYSSPSYIYPYYSSPEFYLNYLFK